MPSHAADLPPLGPLKVFEAAARLENFTHAGRELGLSQAAVSQQVRTLERDLGVTLFERQHRKVSLTPEGTRLFRSVRIGLELIARTSREIRRGQSPTNLRVAADLAFAHYWLLPKIPDFVRRHPHVSPSFVSSDYEADCLRDDIDVAVLYGSGEWPGFNTRFVFGEEIFPVCAPSYVERHGPISLGHLSGHVLIDLHGRWDWVGWSRWASEMAIEIADDTVVREYNSFPLFIQATVNGQGVGLGWKYLCDSLLETGALIKLSESTLRTQRGYYIVTNDSLSEPATEFCEWLTSA